MKQVLLALFICLSCSLSGQNSDSNYVADGLLRLDYENDFFNATDRYYTQGILFTFTHSAIRYSPLSYALIRLNKQAKNYYSLQFQQDCFTPRSIRKDSIYFGERPYAATLFLSHSLQSFDEEKKLLLKTQLDIGYLGPCASCEEEQKAIHKWLNNIQPLGWEYQVAHEYIFNYRAQLEKGFISKKHLEVMGNVAARAGNLYTDLGTGIHVRAGWMPSYFSGVGPGRPKPYKIKTKDDRGGPGPAGPLLRWMREGKLRLFSYVKINAKAVGYNAALQGGAISNNSIYTLSANEIERIVFSGECGIVLHIKRFGLEFSKSYTTKEFNGGVDHGWGKCSFFAGF